MKQVEFFVDGIRYVWVADDCNNISFRLHDKNQKVRLLEGDDKPAEWEWDGFVESFDLTGLGRQPLRVFRKVAELTVAWVAGTRPGFFNFWSNERRKTRVYRMLVQRWLRRLTVPYGFHDFDDCFHFYRLDRQLYARAA